MMDIEEQKRSKRIAKNTLFLYSRTLFSLLINLYISRIVLDNLGVVDFGIYDVVGGFVIMFSILSGSLSSSVSRFITFELGSAQKRVQNIFSTSLIIHFILAFVILIFAEAVGLWFITNKMTIPPERVTAAYWVLQCSILTFVLNLISVPYNALIIAYERMKAFAYIGIFEVILKLIAAVTLIISTVDKLILYSSLLFIIAVIIRLFYGIYCKRKFEEATFKFYFDKNLFKDIFKFAGWNFIGTSSGLLRDQGVNIVLNIFCGPVVNAARAISYQMNSAVQGFVSNFTTALNPQIIKSYASNEHTYMLKLIQQGSRLSFYMLMCLALPLLAETNYILNLWLKEVPFHTVNFVRLVLMFSLIETFSATLITAMLATGRIRNYQLVVGSLQILNFPLSYLLLRYGYPPESTMILAIIISVCCLFARIFMLRNMIKLPVRDFMYKVLLNSLFVLLIASIAPLIILYSMDESMVRFLLSYLICITSALVSIYYIGCSKNERLYFKNKVRTRLGYNS